MSMIDESVSILLVDDKPENLLTLESVLSELRLNVVKAESGRSALKCLLQRDFAVILLDVNMPGMDGFETARLIRQRKNSEHTPILFVTAFSDDMQVSHGYSLGAVDYILTPVVPDVLRTKVGVFIELYRKTEEVRRQAVRLEQRAAQLHRLNQASLLIHSAGSLDDVLRVAADTARDVIGARCAVLIAAEDRDFDHARKVVSPRPSNGNGSHAAPNAQEVRLLLSLDNERRGSPSPPVFPTRLPQNVGGDNNVSNLFAPLLRRDGMTIGLLQLSEKTDGPFTPDDESLLLQVAQMTAVAIENTLGAEAREANRLKDEFLANISHELRTPMNAIIGMTELALSEAVSSEVRDYLGTVKDSAQVLLGLLNDILDFSKIESGKFAFEEQPFRLRDMLAATVEPLQVQANQKGIALDHTVADAIPDFLIGDPLRLRQVVTNLISNAIKFTERGGVQMAVELESCAAQDVVLHFAVIDTGIGISPEDQRKIFSPFTQADSSMTRHFSGTGLGLTISAELVKMMQGQIRVDSEVGRGSTFHFTSCFRLPSEKQLRVDEDAARASQTQPLKELRSGVNKNFRILVAEDTPANQKLINTVLKKLGYVFETVSDGQQALERLEQQHFDLVLLDVQMPKKSGLQVASIIRAREATSTTHIPLVAMTAHAMRGDAERFLAAGMDAYISKPLDISSLGDVIHRFASLVEPHSRN